MLKFYLVLKSQYFIENKKKQLNEKKGLDFKNISVTKNVMSV